MRIRFFAAAAVLLSGAAIAQPWPHDLTGTLRALDAGFVCPQLLPSDDARRAEIASFGRVLAASRLSYVQAMKVRRNFMARHGCDVSAVAEKARIDPALPRQTVALAGIPN